MFEWVNYECKYSHLIDSWLDAEAIVMTGVDHGWENYWKAVRADSVNFPGCEDFCKVIFEDTVPIAAICFGIYQSTMTVGELVIAPEHRGKGKGTQLLKELVEIAKRFASNKANRITAVVFPRNEASQRAFEKAGFCLEGRTEDGIDLLYTYVL